MPKVNYLKVYSAIVLLATAFVHVSGTCGFEELSGLNFTTPEDGERYENARLDQYARRLGTTELRDHQLSPMAVVYCENDDEVLQTIEFASKCGYALAIRSGGHQYSGFSSCQEGTKCIQLDVSKLTVYEYDEDSNIATIGVGWKLGDLIDKMAKEKLVIPTGVCKGVGVGGHFQTSGNGFFARAFGLAMDHVVSFRLATADAEILEVSKKSHPDLYDSVLGGGAGSFGVVLDYNVAPLKADDYPNSYFAAFQWDYERPTYDVLDKLYMEISALPEYARDLELFVFVQPSSEDITNEALIGTDLKHQIRVIIVWVGEDTGPLTGENYEKVVAPFLKVPGIRPGNPRLPLSAFPQPINEQWRSFSNSWQYPYRYWNDNIVSDQFFNEEQLESLHNELDFYLDMSGVWVGLQPQIWGGNGGGSQLNRNVGLNGFPNRDIKVFTDFWVWFSDDETGEMVKKRIEKYRKERKKLFSKLGDVERMYISTDTIEADSVSLKKDWSKFYPSKSLYSFFQDVKKEYDTCDLFHTELTVTLPKKSTRGSTCKKRRSYRRL